MKISEDLLNKYNVPVPRYTSYPPANHFKDSFTAGDYLKMLKESNDRKPEKIAFYIHIPFCQKICYYCGCNACSIGNGNMVAPYLQSLMKEIELVSEHIDKNRKVSQIHYGGGTPNSLDVASIARINEYFFKNYTFTDDPEIAIECNPAYLDFKYLDDLVSAGFNRFSLGIQDFNEDILKQVNRLPSAIHPHELFNYLKSSGKDLNVNFDFIYGLPGQTIDSFSNTIRKAIEIRPDRLVTFSYAHVPWIKKHQLILEKRGLPAPEEKMAMFLAGYHILKDSGYNPIGLDHFVLPSDDLFKAENDGNLHRNFQGYCTRQTTGQVYAFGVTAISQLEQGYSQNKKEIKDYIADIESGNLPVERGYILTDDQIITREVITEIMCNKKIKFSSFSESKNITVNELKKSIKTDNSILKGFEDDGLISFTPDLIEVTESGTFFIRNIAASLDKEYEEKVQTYSKTV